MILNRSQLSRILKTFLLTLPNQLSRKRNQQSPTLFFKILIPNLGKQNWLWRGWLRWTLNQSTWKTLSMLKVKTLAQVMMDPRYFLILNLLLLFVMLYFYNKKLYNIFLLCKALELVLQPTISNTLSLWVPNPLLRKFYQPRVLITNLINSAKFSKNVF